MEVPSLSRRIIWFDFDPNFNKSMHLFLAAYRKDIDIVLAEDEQKVLELVQTADIRVVITNLMIPKMYGAVLVKELVDLVINERWDGRIAMVTNNIAAGEDYLCRNEVDKTERGIPVFLRPRGNNDIYDILAQIGFGISSPVALQSLATSAAAVGNA